NSRGSLKPPLSKNDLSSLPRRPTFKSVPRSTFGQQILAAQSHIAPICGTHIVYGFTIDDIGVASFHGTSINTNDKNALDMVNKQYEHLGRIKDNVCLIIFQKYLTAPKGASSWMLNGMIQVLQFVIIPGNRNADNIDIAIKEFEFIIYLSFSKYKSYHSKVTERQVKAYCYFHNSSTGITNLVCIKHKAPYAPKLESS
ncbi:fatty acid synthase alpha subunit Lsd1, partial [Massospora cicadina]